MNIGNPRKQMESLDKTLKLANKNYLKNTKELKLKHEQFMLKQAHYIQRLTGTN